jgi:hypothetical protein
MGVMQVKVTDEMMKRKIFYLGFLMDFYERASS